MPNTKEKSGSQMSPLPKHKSAMDTLLKSMDELADSAAKRMSTEELRKVRKEINEVVDRVAGARQRRRRETA